MTSSIKPLRWILPGAALAACALAGQAGAEQAPAPSAPVTQSSQSTAQAEAGDPRADTSAGAVAGAAAAPAGPAPAVTPPAAARPAVAPPAPRAPHAAAAGQGSAPGAPQKPAAADRLELGTATVTGDREQPKVMYIVPWKRSDIGDLSGKPMNSLLDEALTPVDRDEFKREVVYYQAVKADASQNGASRPPAKQVEK
jgi:hypothetical protein